MPCYHVVMITTEELWVEADSPQAAKERALEESSDRRLDATYFVEEERVNVDNIQN